MSTSLRREIDLHLGALIRLRRNELGVSQASLARALGVSFQQVQKYERGTNRVSASALYAIAGTLGVAPAFFYEGISMIAGAAPEEGPLVGDQARVSSAQQLEKLLRNVAPKERQALLHLAGALRRRPRKASSARGDRS